MSPKKKAEKAEAEVLGFDEVDLDSMVVCGACGNSFCAEISEVCPTCKGEGLNPGPEKEDEDEDFEETSHFNKGW